jgi:NAD(P)-dependent dehydrogenase (short-subunit alcohol dehydrogenase family)
MSMLLKDRVALVTGGGRGLGQAVARAYAKQGARVLITGRTQFELDQTAASIEVEGGHVLTMAVDLLEEHQVRGMVKWALGRLGRVDVLVNNAARLPLQAFEAMTMANWDRTMAVNLRAPVLMSKLLLDTMKAQNGASIINVSSNAGVKGFRLETDYCASKFALEGFTRALALEVQPYNISVNTITPGGLAANIRFKPTSMTQGEFDALSEDERARWSDPMILTEAFIFLALQDGNGVTGERINAYELSEQIRREGWEVAYKTA